MDHPFPSFPAYAIAFLLLVFTLLASLKKTKAKRKAIPGPWKLPIIGNIHQLANSQAHHRLRDLARKHGPIMQLQLGQLPCVVISSAEAAKEVMTTHDALFAQRPISVPIAVLTYNCKEVAFGQYGDYWRQLRKMFVVELLSTRRVQSFKSIREEEVFSFVRSIIASSSGGLPVNIGQMLLGLTSSIISRTAFGGSNVEKHASIIKRISEVLGGFTIADFFPSFGFLHALDGVKHEVMKLHEEMDAIVQRIIDDNRAKRDQAEELAARGEAESILDVLLDIQDRGELELTTENIKAILFDLFNGGIETSATTMEWTLSELLRNTRVLKKAQAEVRQVFHGKGEICETKLHELTYLNAVIKEALRLHPPGPLLLPREARQDVRINGYHIPVKTKVIVNAWAIGRDPNYWSEPERFYPERFLTGTAIDYKGTHFEFLPFGAGRRICPGMLFATSIMELALANLLYHFDWKLPGGCPPENLDMSEARGLVVARNTPLHLIAIPNHHALSTVFNN